MKPRTLIAVCSHCALTMHLSMTGRYYGLGESTGWGKRVAHCEADGCGVPFAGCEDRYIMEVSE